MPGNIEGIIRIRVLLEGESYWKIYSIYITKSMPEFEGKFPLLDKNLIAELEDEIFEGDKKKLLWK